MGGDLTIAEKNGKINNEVMPNPNEHFDTTKRMAAYENATRLLVQRAQSATMPDGFKSKYDTGKMVMQFRAAFKSPELRSKVLASKYEAQRIQSARFSAGFCGVASYTWGHLFRMPDGQPIWNARQVVDLDGVPNHVWLENVYDGQVLDLTFDQFVDGRGTIIEYPYDLGQPASLDITFRRGFVFGNYIGVDLEMIALINRLNLRDLK